MAPSWRIAALLKSKGANKMKVSLSKDQKSLIVELPLISPPKTSSSGKTLLVATTGGNKETEVEVNGQLVHIGCNAYIYATPKGTKV